LLRQRLGAVGQGLQLLVQIRREIALQGLDVAAAGADHVGHPVVVQKREEHVLHTQELVPAAARFVDGERERRFEATGEVH
jgi:hypothetical protein